jgi:hypothetical protein
MHPKEYGNWIWLPLTLLEVAAPSKTRAHRGMDAMQEHSEFIAQSILEPDG